MLIAHITLLAALKPTYAVVFGVTLIVLHLLAVFAVTLGSGSAKRKFVWSAAILLLPALGVTLYLVMGKNDADRPLLD